MSEISLRYGINPRNSSAHIALTGKDSPFEVLNGDVGYINIIDALTAWQLVAEASAALHHNAAVSIKHTNPVGMGLSPMSEPIGKAYVRARNCDPMASFGDFIGVSGRVDGEAAAYIAKTVSHGIIASGYDEEALTILRRKRSGEFIVLRANPSYTPPDRETRDVFGVQLVQTRDRLRITHELLDVDAKAASLPTSVRDDLVLAAIAARYCESNAIAMVLNGQLIGVGCGQPSRIAATEIACGRADLWKLRQVLLNSDLPLRKDVKQQEVEQCMHAMARQSLLDPSSAFSHPALHRPMKSLELAVVDEALRMGGLASMWSDGFIPFEDNIDVAAKHHVGYIGQPGGSVRDQGVLLAAEKYGIVVLRVGERFFYH